MITSCNRKQAADTLLFGGKIYTLSDSMPVADAIVIKTGKILAIGSKDELLARFKPVHIEDLENGYIYPGFIDAHCHFYGFARGLQWIDLVGCTSFEEVLLRISEANSKDTEWITGRGWDQNLWEDKKFPTKEKLDLLFPDRPVVLVRIDGHVVLANQVALDRAGIDEKHRFSRGEVETENGKLTGILSENASDFMRSQIPKPEKEILVKLLRQAQHRCFEVGLTGVSDAGLEFDILRLLDSIQQHGELKIHVYAMIDPTPENIKSYLHKGPYRTDLLTIRSVKLYADGSLGSHTALLKQPYTDNPLHAGIQVTSSDSIRKICRLAFEHGYQVNTHCIGDSANALVLRIYGEFLQKKNDRRWRIEHAQVVDPADIHLFSDYSVIPSIQATHATSDMYWAGDRLGSARIKWAYAYKDLLNQNGWLANGTDFPIERINPLLTFYAAVTRQDLTGTPRGGFQPENALLREEALKSITLWVARANFEEDLSGSLEPGKWADLVILDRDILKIPSSEIPSVKVLKTYSHGVMVFPEP